MKHVNLKSMLKNQIFVIVYFYLQINVSHYWISYWVIGLDLVVFPSDSLSLSSLILGSKPEIFKIIMSLGAIYIPSIKYSTYFADHIQIMLC